MPLAAMHRTSRCGVTRPSGQACAFVRCPARPLTLHRGNPWLCSADATDGSVPASGNAASPSSPNPGQQAPAGASPEQPEKLSMQGACSEALGNIPVSIIGDDSDLNWAVCKILSKKIGWFPVSTRKVLLGLHKAADMEELEQKLGKDGIVAEELKVIKGLSSQFRCCVATLGSGATLLEQSHPYLYGHLIIWLEETNKKKPRTLSPERQQLYEDLSEVRAKIDTTPTTGFAKPVSSEEKAKRAVGQLIKAINRLIKDHSYLPDKKRLYITYGCRGDWPELKPQEWSPVLELLDRKVPEPQS